MISIVAPNKEVYHYASGKLGKFINTSKKNIAERKKTKLDIKKQDAKTRNDAVKALSAPTPKPTTKSPQAPAKAPAKSNTMLYVGIGVAIIAAGIGVYFLVKKKKK